MRTTAFATLALLAASGLAAQDPPATDLYLLELTAEGPDTPVRLSDRDGYDNQPSFTPDGRAVLYTSIRDGQADTYRIELATGRTTHVTDTPESEYSPTVMPGGDRISVVRVEADGTQRLWSFARDGSAPRLVLPHVQPVGYHVWADDHTLGLFVLGEPSTLRLADTDGGVTTVTGDIGRSLQKVPGRRAISFVHRFSDDDWWIREYDLDARRLGRIAPLLGPDDYHAWLPDGTLLTARASRVYRWDGSEWVVLAELADAGITGLTRLAVSPDGSRLALVAAR